MAGNTNKRKPGQPESVGEILGSMPDKSKPTKRKTAVPAAGQGSSAGKGGRPTTYNDEIAAEICAQLAMGDSLRTVCRSDSMPAASTVFLWLREHEEFSEQYARAKQESADAMAEDILDIADDGTNDWMEREREDGSTYEVVNNEVIQRSRLRVDTRKWLMAKMKPKKYGDKLDLTSGGDKLNRGMSDAELDAILAREAGATPDKASEDTKTR